MQIRNDLCKDASTSLVVLRPIGLVVSIYEKHLLTLHEDPIALLDVTCDHMLQPVH